MTSFASVMDHIAQGFEGLGAAVLVAGVIWSATLAIVAWRRSGPQQAFTAVRRAGTSGASQVARAISAATQSRPE
jgi:hypothetical protein